MVGSKQQNQNKTEDLGEIFMGFWGKLLGVKTIENTIKDLESSIEILKRSVLNYLQKELYLNQYGCEAPLWTTAVLNTMILSPSGNEEARAFYEKNEDSIWQKSLQIKKYPDLSGTSGGASYLYFAMCFHATAMMNNPHLSDVKKAEYMSQITDLSERASQLGVFVPSVKDNMRNSKDPNYIIDCVCTFTENYSKKLWNA